MKGYCSEEKKTFKEYIYSVSFMTGLGEYFTMNKLEENKLRKYSLCLMILFYLKLNYHLHGSLVSRGELMVIEEQRRNDKKLKKK